jgi:hypothetical protein
MSLAQRRTERHDATLAETVRLGESHGYHNT